MFQQAAKVSDCIIIHPLGVHLKDTLHIDIKSIMLKKDVCTEGVIQEMQTSPK